MKRMTRPDRLGRPDLEAANRPGRRPAILLFLLCLAAYLGNCRTVPLARGGDTIPNRLIPFSLLASGTPVLDAFRPDFAAAGVTTWYLVERRGSLVSFYPVGTSLAALPVYLPVYGFAAIGGRPPASTLFLLSEPAEKLAASVLTAFAVVLFYFMARRRMEPRQAFGAAMVFGLASSMWATASQMLWQQTAVAAALTVALWLLTWPELPRWAAAGAGAALSLAVAARPTAGLLFAAGLATTLLAPGEPRQRAHRGAAYLLGALPLLLIGLGINWHYYGHLGGGYAGLIGFFTSGLFTAERLQGIPGLLVSPNRGLLVFTPIALLGIWGLARQIAPGEPRDPALVSFGIATLVCLLVAGAYPDWWGGWSFGPRYLVDVLPVLGLAGIGVWDHMGIGARRLAKAAIVWSLLVQINGAFCFPASRWDPRMSKDPAQAAWNWKEFELWQDFRSWAGAGQWSTPF
jgi:hypothetical protein